jgi:recombinational DNA repair ATPase RecF
MKIVELEINNIRGIKNLSLKPNGKTFVIWGPNGTGKSGVIDSIDFLLTGKVTRLLGQGTKDLSLKAHGAHIDVKTEEAFVKALVKIEGVENPIELIREMAQPQILKIKGCEESQLIPITSIAERGQHILTRREILRYITAEPGTRSQQIQILLNIFEIEKIRKIFVKVSGNATKIVRATSKALEQAKIGAISTIQDSKYSADLVLQFVNKQRAILNGGAIENLKSKNLKEGIVAPKLVSGTNQNISLIEQNVENILKIETKSEPLSTANQLLNSTIKKVTENPELLIVFRRKELIELGIETLEAEDINNCPLCDKFWEDSLLLEHLNQKLATIEEAGTFNSTIEQQANIISNEAKFILTNLSRLINVIGLIQELKSHEKVLNSWRAHLEELLKSLETPITKYLDFDLKGREITNLLAPKNINKTFEEIVNLLKAKFPKSSPEQNAWDTLTRLEENLKAIETADAEHKKSKLFEKRATILQSEFVKSRDRILNELYEEIQQRFVELYIGLHGEDEKNFKAKLEPKEAALNFEVDFYGRGTYPPHALHSEGHQDSMGLCLFLALAEYLAEGIIDIILLDDVVMSVDADHRRSLCKLLVTSFPNKQFMITTHDKTWANQLKTEGIVTSSTSIEFYNWDIDSGPHVNFEKDIWKDVKAALEENDIPKGAAKLRRGAESFFEAVCDALEVPVIYRQNRRWELGHFMPAAFSHFKKDLKSAISAARSWGDEDTVLRLTELEHTASQIYTRTLAEQWGVNSSVHYNEWAELNKNDFKSIAESFEDLFNIFLCQNCRGMIRLVKNGLANEAIKCNCGSVNWNLVKKKN